MTECPQCGEITLEKVGEGYGEFVNRAIIEAGVGALT